MIALDDGCRGAAAGLLLMVAVVLLRNQSSAAARLGAVLAVAGATYAIIEAPGFPADWRWLGVPLIASGPVAFWLWARAAFDDDFVFRPWHGGVWAILVALRLIASWGIVARPASAALNRGLTLVDLVLAALAVAQTLATWRMDLVAGRRRLRVGVLIGTLAYIATDAAAALSPASVPVLRGWSGSLASALGLCLLAAIAGWDLFGTAATGPVLRPAPAAAVEPEDRPGVEPALLGRLERLMTEERAYRREGLTIGALAGLMGLPEYRLRQIINEGLGHRNFNAFLNRYRIDEAKAALADPGQKDVPVLTIAMDAGFQSLGPFNRAFKADTGLTPTEFRRIALSRR